MSIRREKIYRCTLVTRTRRIVGLVRAWDAREAVSIYREDLAATGVTARGTIQVTDLAAPLDRGYELAAS
jgi:hypothetical protein